MSDYETRITPPRDTVRVKPRDDVHKVTRDDGSKGNKREQDGRPTFDVDNDTVDIHHEEREIPLNPHDEADQDQATISLKSIRASLLNEQTDGQNADPSILADQSKIDPAMREALNAYAHQQPDHSALSETPRANNNPLLTKIDDLLALNFDDVTIEDGQSYDQLINGLWSHHVEPNT